jgi:hypothetical protein
MEFAWWSGVVQCGFILFTVLLFGVILVNGVYLSGMVWNDLK